MTFFPSASSSSAVAAPNIEVSVTPSASAYYAGDVFAATIRFRNTRSTSTVDGVIPEERYQRKRKIGLRIPQTRTLDSPYSPGANPDHRASGWPRHENSIRSPEAWKGRRTQSLALGTMSPQEMIWALGDSSKTPPLPPRPVISTTRHSRKESRSVQPKPPPKHPQVAGSVKIVWAYSRLRGQFHPSNSYIPPDPLLPLRSTLLHQPLGSGSMGDGMTKSTSSRWQLSFGTGAVGHSSQPSLTGSLFGLARELVGGKGGSLEEERKRVWNMKDLPVFETERSVLGVDLELKAGEMTEFTFEATLPTSLPPAFRGRAYRFSYDLVCSLSFDGHTPKEVTVPLRIWPNVSLDDSVDPHDVLRPIIPDGSSRPKTARPVAGLGALEQYAAGLDSMDDQPETRSGGCGEAVEVLSRHSAKACYDISKDGADVAELILAKTTFRLGESILGAVKVNRSGGRRVLRFSAQLESHEIIPDNLLPPGAKHPDLARLHAEHRTSYCMGATQLPFELDIPSDATPTFSFNCGQEGDGGLNWTIKFEFLVSTDQESTDSYETNRLESPCDVVECQIPVTVLAGNTAFVVRPITQMV